MALHDSSSLPWFSTSSILEPCSTVTSRVPSCMECKGIKSTGMVHRPLPTQSAWYSLSVMSPVYTRITLSLTILLILLGDGLRADLLFTPDAFQFDGAPSVVAPYLRSIVEKRGAFGISHTHVPTESRPGHVAIIGELLSLFSTSQRTDMLRRWHVRRCLGCDQGKTSIFRPYGWVH